MIGILFAPETVGIPHFPPQLTPSWKKQEGYITWREVSLQLPSGIPDREEKIFIFLNTAIMVGLVSSIIEIYGATTREDMNGLMSKRETMTTKFEMKINTKNFTLSKLRNSKSYISSPVPLRKNWRSWESEGCLFKMMTSLQTINLSTITDAHLIFRSSGKGFLTKWIDLPYSRTKYNPRIFSKEC